jgi:tetratricopeptide (TPR) repeat protein/transcriptional regulator with XRE-family HTH domain
MDSHGAGWRLRAARAELGLTEDALAGAMRRWAEVRNEPRPDITPEAVAEWEGGLRPLDPPTMRLLWLALEVPGWDRAGHVVDTWSLFRPSRPAPNQGQRRRDLVGSLAALGEPAGLDPERLSGALEETLKVDRPLVEGLTFVARRFPKEWGQQPPQALRQHVHAHLQVVHALLDGLMPGGSRRELESAAATTATVAGLIALLVDRHEDAGIYLQIAVRLGGSAGDAEAHALALMLASYLSSAVEPDAQSPDPALASAQIEAAVGLVSPETSPLARAWVLLRAAQEHAWGGDELGAYRLLDEAERLSSSGQVPADGLVSPWTADTHITFQGEVAAMCGRYDEAIALLEAGLAKLGPDRVARRPRALSDLAAAYARQGSVDHACELLVQAFELAQRAGLSERIPRIVGVRDRYLAAHAAEAAVRRLDELILAR